MLMFMFQTETDRKLFVGFSKKKGEQRDNCIQNNQYRKCIVYI